MSKRSKIAKPDEPWGSIKCVRGLEVDADVADDEMAYVFL
jgi:hypothetical protein